MEESKAFSVSDIMWNERLRAQALEAGSMDYISAV